jgi:large subunit ribosomal protein L25
MRVIPREVQVDPVTDQPIHADFQRLVAGARIRLFIPVHFNNHADSPGLKRGGVLNVVRHEIEFFCPSERIPQYIEADLKGMDIGDSLHISHIKLPEGLQPVIRNRDFTVATVAAPSAMGEAEAKPTAAAEGEAAAGAAPAAGAAAAAGAAPAAGAKAAAPAAGGKAAAPAAAAKATAAKAPAAKK